MTTSNFTDNDRERMVRMETMLSQLVKSFDKLPCQQEPPVCTQESRIKSLETSRKTTIGAIVAIFVGLAVWAVKAVAGLF